MTRPEGKALQLLFWSSSWTSVHLIQSADCRSAAEHLVAEHVRSNSVLGLGSGLLVRCFRVLLESRVDKALKAAQRQFAAQRQVAPAVGSDSAWPGLITLWASSAAAASADTSRSICA